MPHLVIVSGFGPGAIQGAPAIGPPDAFPVSGSCRFPDKLALQMLRPIKELEFHPQT